MLHGLHKAETCPEGICHHAEHIAQLIDKGRLPALYADRQSNHTAQDAANEPQCRHQHIQCQQPQHQCCHRTNTQHDNLKLAAQKRPRRLLHLHVQAVILLKAAYLSAYNLYKKP